MSYQLHCPNCSAMIPTENINVQQTIAACPECSAVFNFGENIPSGQKIKRRKSKKPDNITQIETADSLTLEMPYLQTMSYKFWMGALGVFITGLYALIMISILSDVQPEWIALGVLSFIFIPLILIMFGSIFARQSIEVNADDFKHEVRLGIPVYQRKIAVDDVVDVTLDEMTATRESVAEARYNLYAEKYDGRQDMFIQNLPEEMASYTQQTLSGYFKAGDADSVRLSVQDDVSDSDEMLIIEDQQENQAQM